jgi:hypothetical protein
LGSKWVKEEEMRLSQVRFRLGDEVVTFDKTIVFHEEVLSKKAIVNALQGWLDLEFRFLEAGVGRFLEEASPRMLVFLRTFAKHEDPLGALEKGRFLPHTVAGMFLDM